MPSPVRNRAASQLCSSFVLVPFLLGCAVETVSLRSADAVGEPARNRTALRPAAVALQTDPSIASSSGPQQAAFMTEGSGTTVGYDVFGPEGPLASRTTFTPRPGSDFGRAAEDTVWIGRRETFGQAGGQDVTATSSIECPGLVHVLERISALNPGRLNVSGISRRATGLGPQSRDGSTYRFFGPGYGTDDSRVHLSVEGSAGDIKDLGMAADFQLQACWRPE
jgi:hypothetical protein